MDGIVFKDKQVLIMGLGRFGGGVDAAKFTHSAGAKVAITDLLPAEELSDSISQLKELDEIRYHLGSHDRSDFEKADVVIVNPAVPQDNEFVKLARTCGKFVTSQIEIFFQLCSATIVGITGANGKSTTAALTAHLLRAARQITNYQLPITNHQLPITNYQHVWLSGNIGNEPLLTILDQIDANDLVVLELSSFQIEQLAQIKKAPKVALLTNLTPNHLDRYGTFENYCAAKENIFKFQRLDKKEPAVSIFNADDKVSRRWFDKYSKQAGRLCISFSADDISEALRERFTLPGRANLSNLAAALSIARYFGVTDEAIKTCLPEFRALPHRLELVAEINGVKWYNDSKATTPESAITALEAFDQPIIIIAGGYDKNIPFDEFGKKIAEKAKIAILLGQTTTKIADAIKLSLRAKRSNLKSRLTSHDSRAANVPFTNNQSPITSSRTTIIHAVNSLAQSVQFAKSLAVTGDVVLLSPACASYDMFDNFEHRGREFCKLVMKIRH
jgi:UDP-N-acetylmuramoylalanine--D-glutamate ligase